MPIGLLRTTLLHSMLCICNIYTNTYTKILNAQFRSYSKVSYHFSTQNVAINPMGMTIWPNTNPKYKSQIQIPNTNTNTKKPKMLCFGHTPLCIKYCNLSGVKIKVRINCKKTHQSNY